MSRLPIPAKAESVGTRRRSYNNRLRMGLAPSLCAGALVLAIGGCGNKVDTLASRERVSATTTTITPTTTTSELGRGDNPEDVPTEPGQTDTGTGGPGTGRPGGIDTGNETLDSILERTSESFPDLSIPELSIPDISIPNIDTKCIDLSLDYAKLALSAFDSSSSTDAVVQRLEAAFPEDLQDDLQIVAKTYETVANGGLGESADALADKAFNDANGAISAWLVDGCN